MAIFEIDLGGDYGVLVEEELLYDQDTMTAVAQEIREQLQHTHALRVVFVHGRKRILGPDVDARHVRETTAAIMRAVYGYRDAHVERP